MFGLYSLSFNAAHTVLLSSKHLKAYDGIKNNIINPNVILLYIYKKENVLV